MTKKGKKFISLLVAFVILGNMSFASMPVLDVANLMQTIEGVYKHYQQVKLMIDSVQKQYEEIQIAAQSIASMNFDDLSAKLGKNWENVNGDFVSLDENPFETITAVRNSAQDITRAVNVNMDKVNRLADSLTDQNVEFGGMKVSVADLCGAGEPEKNIMGFSVNAWDHTVESGKDAVAGYTGNLTYRQKEAIARKYGMSARNYATLEMANYQLSELVTSSNLEATYEGQVQLLTEIRNNENAIKTLAQNLPDGSTYAATQLSNSILGDMQGRLGDMYLGLKKGFGLIGQKIFSDKAKEAIEQEQAEQDAKAKKEKAQIDHFPSDVINKY